jgi:hypothetical protein
MFNSTIESPLKLTKWLGRYGSLIRPVRLLVALMLACAVPLIAQTGAGSLRVLVEDNSGAIIPGASVQVIDVATNVSRTQNTNSSGYAVFSPVDRGTYNVRVTRPGFATLDIGAVTIDVNQNREVTAQLSVAKAATTVEVQAAAVALQTEDASQGALVTNNEIVNLPLAERRYTDLTLLAPGAQPSNASQGYSASIRGTDWIAINGTRSTQNNFLLDGMDNNENTHNEQSRSAEIVAPPPDGIAQFQVLTDNPTAVYGRSAGGVIIASIKSGTNNLHGDAWEFNRETGLAANSWLSNHNNAGKDRLVWNQPGGAIGGPIIKDKLFYFGDYEYLTSTAYSSILATVPVVSTPAGLGGNVNGDFSNLTIQLYDPLGNPIPNNVFKNDPNVTISPLGQKVMQLYPAPNLPGTFNAAGQPVNNYGRSLSLTNSEQKADFRVDYYKSLRNQFFGRYSINQSDLYQENNFPNPIADSGEEDFGGPELARNQSGVAGWTFIINPTMVNDFRFGYNNTSSSFAESSEGLESGTAFGFLGLPSDWDDVGSLPDMIIGSYQSLGDGPWRPQYDNPWEMEFNENFSLTKGAQTLQVGVDYRVKQGNYVDDEDRTVNPSFTGAISGKFVDAGDGAADLMMGYAAALGAETFMFAHVQQRISAYYIQDDWKARKNFTVNLGMRYEYYTPPFGVGQFVNVNFNMLTGQLNAAPGAPLVVGNGQGVQVVPASNKYAVQPDKADWGPRVGLIYQLGNKIDLRGGFGYYYNGEDFYGSNGTNLVFNPPDVYELELLQVGVGPESVAPAPWNINNPLPSSLANTSTLSSTTFSVNASYPQYQVGRVEEWNGALQYLINPSSTLTLAYVGNSSHGMELSWSANNAPYGVDGSIQANRPYPLMNGVAAGDYQGGSKFSSLQVELEKRTARGISTLLAYTYANAFMDTNEFGASGAPPVEVAENPAGALPYPIIKGPYGIWGHDSEEPHQRFTDSTVWALPFGRGMRFGSGVSRALNYVVGGWSLSGIVTRTTGTPFSISLAGSGSSAATSTTPAESWTSYSNSGQTNRPNCDIPQIASGAKKTPDTPNGNWVNLNAFSPPTINGTGQAVGIGVCPGTPIYGPGDFDWDQSVIKSFPIRGEGMYAEFHADFFNLTNHPDFANPGTTSFGSGGFGQVTTTNNTPRQVQLAVKFYF